jgi:hypothetical protein
MKKSMSNSQVKAFWTLLFGGAILASSRLATSGSAPVVSSGSGQPVNKKLSASMDIIQANGNTPVTLPGFNEGSSPITTTPGAIAKSYQAGAEAAGAPVSLSTPAGTYAATTAAIDDQIAQLGDTFDNQNKRAYDAERAMADAKLRHGVTAYTPSWDPAYIAAMREYQDWIDARMARGE